MKPNRNWARIGRWSSAILFSIVLFLSLLLAVWNYLQMSGQARRLVVLQSNAVTVSHRTRFMAITNGPPIERVKRFANWQIDKLRGQRFPALSPEITVLGLANLYRSIDLRSAGMIVPLEFGDLKARFPTNCVLTNKATSVGAFRSGLEETLAHNGIVGLREGSRLRLVKKEWVRTNATSDPTKNPSTDRLTRQE